MKTYLNKMVLGAAIGAISMLPAKAQDKKQNTNSLINEVTAILPEFTSPDLAAIYHSISDSYKKNGADNVQTILIPKKLDYIPNYTVYDCEMEIYNHSPNGIELYNYLENGWDKLIKKYNIPNGNRILYKTLLKIYSNNPLLLDTDEMPGKLIKDYYKLKDEFMRNKLHSKPDFKKYDFNNVTHTFEQSGFTASLTGNIDFFSSDKSGGISLQQTELQDGQYLVIIAYGKKYQEIPNTRFKQRNQIYFNSVNSR